MSVTSRLEELLKRVQRNRERAAEALEPSPSSIPAQRAESVVARTESVPSFDDDTGEIEESRSKRPTIEEALPQTMYDSKIPSAAWEEAPDTMMDPGGMRLRELHIHRSDTRVYGAAPVRSPAFEPPKVAPPPLNPLNMPPAPSPQHTTLQGSPAPSERTTAVDSPSVATFGGLFRRALALRVRK